MAESEFKNLFDKILESVKGKVEMYLLQSRMCINTLIKYIDLNFLY